MPDRVCDAACDRLQHDLVTHQNRLRWGSRLGSERPLFELAAAVRAHRGIASGQMSECVAPGLKPLGVESRLLGA